MTSRTKPLPTALATLAALATFAGAAIGAAAGAGDRLPRGNERVSLDPANFTTRISTATSRSGRDSCGSTESSTSTGRRSASPSE